MVGVHNEVETGRKEEGWPGNEWINGFRNNELLNDFHIKDFDYSLVVSSTTSKTTLFASNGITEEKGSRGNKQYLDVCNELLELKIYDK